VTKVKEEGGPSQEGKEVPPTSILKGGVLAEEERSPYCGLRQSSTGLFQGEREMEGDFGAEKGKKEYVPFPFSHLWGKKGKGSDPKRDFLALRAWGGKGDLWLGFKGRGIGFGMGRRPSPGGGTIEKDLPTFPTRRKRFTHGVFPARRERARASFALYDDWMSSKFLEGGTPSPRGGGPHDRRHGGDEGGGLTV